MATAVVRVVRPPRQPVRRLSTTKMNEVRTWRYWVCYGVSTQPMPPMTRANAPPMANRGPIFLVQPVMALLALKRSRSSLPVGPKVRKSPMGKVNAPNTATAKNALFTREGFAEARPRLSHPALSGALFPPGSVPSVRTLVGRSPRC